MRLCTMKGILEYIIQSQQKIHIRMETATDEQKEVLMEIWKQYEEDKLRINLKIRKEME